MSVLATCFKCGRKLRIHDHLIGRMARCPVCQSIFMTAGDPQDPPAAAEPEIHVAPYGSAPPIRRPPPASADEEILEGVLHKANEEPPERDYPRPARRRRLKAIYPGNWRKVRVGVTIILSSVILLCLTLLLACGGGLATGYSRIKANQAANADAVKDTPLALIVIVVLMALTSQVLSLIGNAFCLAAPEKHAARTLAVIVLVLGVLTLCLQIIAVELPVIELVGSIVGMARFFVFMAFLNALARCLNRKDLQDTVATATTLAGLTFGLWITTVVITLVGIANGFIDPKAPENPGSLVYLVGVLGCIGGIIGLSFIFWYIKVVEQTRDEIGYYLGESY